MSRPLQVGFMGAKGAYGERAARLFGGEAAELLGVETFEEVFARVQSGRLAFGVVPVENAFAGAVTRTLDLLLDSKLEVVGEVRLPIHHCLLAPKGLALEAVEEVCSHPQALAQCKDFLEARRLVPIPERDTATAARLVAEGARPNAAAIASREAAARYGLTILSEEVAPRGNQTRFWAVALPGTGVAQSGAALWTTAFAFVPSGSLAEALAPFANRALPVGHVQVRPWKGRPFGRVFFAEVEGEAFSTEVEEALAELAPLSERLVRLGHFPSAKEPGAVGDGTLEAAP